MNRFIGLLDSGMGGLTVLNQVIASLPEENTVYFGDMVRLRIQDIVDHSNSLILFGNDDLLVVLHYLLFTRANQPGREALSEATMQYAAQFVRTGDPNTPGSGPPEWRPWSNEPDGPKCILFDVDEDQALDVRMSTDELTEAGLAERMAAEVPEPLYSQAVEYLSGWQLTEAD